MSEGLQNAPEGCLGQEAIVSFLEDKLPSVTRELAAEHFVSCDACRKQLTGLALGTKEKQSYSSVVLDEVGTGVALPANAAEGSLPPGTSLGRYVVLGKVGAGGMGVVYSAYDPELERRIAIKVIRAEILKDTDRAHASLREEARAMAQLTHPNVVRVYDVGTQGELVYIAMEYIEGEDLLQFAKRHRVRGEWRPIFEACLQAGRGLQAAHEAGLVHRDFKPSNVLVSKDKRVFVADFGLTRLFSKTVGEDDAGWSSASGTPGYAAPEQLAGKPCDVKSDQFSFCVTVAECLFGRDPMSKFIRLDSDKSQRLNCPKGMGSVVERGLTRDSSGRFESMHDLLDKLEARAHGRRRRVMVAGALAGIAGVGLLMFSLGALASGPEDPCAAGAERFVRLFDEARHDKLEAVLATTRYKRHSAYFLERADGMAHDLVEVQKLSCAATFKVNAQSPELFDRQMFCLNSHATELDAIISMVEGGASVETAQSALGSLPSAADCQVSESLLATPPPPSDPNSLARIQVIEDKLAQRRALEEAKKPLLALEKVDDAIIEASDLGYGPLLTRAELVKSQLLADLERYPEAQQAAERARDAAAQARDTRRLIIALLRLASIVSTHEDDADEANAYLATARSLSLGIELPAIDKVEIEITSGGLAQASGDFEQAVRYANAGLSLLGKGAEDEQESLNATIALQRILAAAHFAANDFEDAAILMRSTHELEKKRLGPEHSGLVASLTNIATIDYKLGKFEDALALLGRAHELLASPDAKRADWGQVYSLEALIQNRLGNLPEAIALYLQTIEVYKELFGEDHPNIWRTKANLANTYMALQKWPEAIEIQEGFLAWTIERYGADNPTAVNAKLNLASTMVYANYETGEVQGAIDLLAELARDLPVGDPTQVGVRVMQGNALLALKQFDQAATAFEETLKWAEKTPNAEPSFPASTTGAWADALWQAGKRSQALTVARRALLLYDKLGPEMAAMRTEQEAWVVEKERELAGDKR